MSAGPGPQAAPAAAKPAAADGLPKPRRFWAALTVVVAMSLAVLDSTIANVALPTIATDLRTTPAAAVWIVNAYNLTIVLTLLPFSALAERIGFKRMFAGGLVLFMTASLASALSTSLLMLTVARILQGVGAASLMCLFGGLVRNIYPLALLGRGISVNAMVVGVMSVLGPSVGAAILSVATWQWIFAVNVPVGMLALCGMRALPDVPSIERRFDWASAALSMVVFALFIIGIDHLASDTLRALGMISVAAAAGVVLVRRSSRQQAPLVPVDLLRIRPLAYAVMASGWSFAAQMASFVALPFYFQQTMNRDHIMTGLLLGAWPIGAAFMAPLAGRLSDRHTAAVLSAIGAGSMALGLTWLVLLPASSSNAWIVVGMLLAGIGFGFFQTPNNRAMLSAAPRNRSGAAGGLQATTRVFGQTFGTALVAIGFRLSTDHGPAVALCMAIVCALLALAVNAVRIKVNPT